MSFQVSELMAAACAANRVNGFVKKHEARPHSEPPVKANSRMLYDHFFGTEQLAITEDDRFQALDVIDYLKGLSFKAFERDLTDFEQNVLKLVTADMAESSELGIAASLPKVYLNKLDQDTWEVRERELAETSEYVGTVLTRCDFDLVIENIRYIKTTGASLYCCSVDGKHVVKFFSDDVNWGKVGDQIQVAGYVKSQSVSKFSGGKETMINRIKEITSDG
jgi:hypothetical protein